MKVGVVLPQHESDRETLFAAAKLAQEAGLDSLWVADHLVGRGDPSRPILEGWTALAAAAARVDELEVGTLVLRAGLRLPLLVTNMFSTLDSIAPGRVVAGLGTGDTSVALEQAVYGIPLTPRNQRIRWVEETISLMKRRAPGVRIWVGGGSREAMGLAVSAGGWNVWGPAREFTGKLAQLRALAGGEKIEASWAGSFPGSEALEMLQEAGADHAIVAVGASNFSERIDALRRWAGTSRR